MGTVARLYANGDFLIQGELDEVTLVGTNIAQRVDATGNYYVREFDEVNDPSTFVEGPAGDTNLQFNVEPGPLYVLYVAEEVMAIYSNGGVEWSGSPAVNGDGSWYNGTPTATNFEAQIEVTSSTNMKFGIDSGNYISGTTGTSAWYTIPASPYLLLRAQSLSPTSASGTLVLRIREIVVPSNQISQTFNFSFN